MPRINDEFLECVMYLYPSVADAQAGRRQGGAGFWVSVDSEQAPGMVHTYAVTNKHVVNSVQGDSRVLRINRRDGGFDTIETEEAGWVFHPDGDDLAVYPFNLDAMFQARFVSERQLLSKEIVSRYDIGPGSDVVLVSRFVSHDGKESNTPALRFGNISMMPLEPVVSPIGVRQESFLVEGRSLPGASGSPVFVLFSIHDHLRTDGMPMVEKAGGPWLLGINWGHFNLVDPDFEFVRDSAGKAHPENWRVRVNTGMMQVVPAWKLRELLDAPELVHKRDLETIEHAKKRAEFLASFDAMDVPRDTQKKMFPHLFPQTETEEG